MTLIEKILFGFFVVGFALPFNGINYPVYVYCGLLLLFYKLILGELVIKRAHLFSYFLLVFFLIRGYEDVDFFFFIIINIISLLIIDNYWSINKINFIAVCIFSFNSLIITLEIILNRSFLIIPDTLLVESRFQGFSLYGGSVMSVILFFVLINLEKLPLNKIIIFILFALNIFALLIVGRFGLYMYFIYLVYNSIKLSFYRIIIILCGVLFCYYLSISIDIGSLRAFDLLSHFFDYGNFQTSGVTQFAFQLDEFVDKFEFSLFGNGNFGMRDLESKELGFDSALLRIYHGSGLFGILAYVYIFLRSGKYILLFYNLKEFLFYNNSVIYFLYERKNHR